MPHAASFLSRLALLVALGAGLSACKTDGDITGSIASADTGRGATTPEQREARWRELSARYATAYEKNPADPATALGYGMALRALGQRAQAVAVLESASIKHPQQRQILGAYGRALADVGRYDDALAVLERSHSPEAPDWKILNAQGAILDQTGRSAEARGYYAAALKIAPGEPSILSNLGLSYALTKEIGKAEDTLRMAAASPKADDTVRANLALVERLKAGGKIAKAS